MNPLWHYTCPHGLDGIRRSGWKLIAREQLLNSWIWATDLDVPVRDALGLTSHMLDCDRTTHRLAVIDDHLFVPWTSIRRLQPAWFRDALEQAPGAMPRHWFVAAPEHHVAVSPA